MGLAIVPTAGAAKRKVPRGFFGTMYDGAVAQAPFTAQDKQFAVMAQAGVESARLLFPWVNMQPYQGMKSDFSRTDVTVGAAAAHGIDILPVVVYAPYWARLNKKRPLSPPKSPRSYAAFIRAAIKRYGPKGSFWAEHPGVPRRPIRRWQVWNEPDIRPYWEVSSKSRYAWPKGYGQLLKAANKAIKRADRGAKTVLAGLTAVAWLDLRRAYKRGGIRGHFDIASLQVYPQTERRELEAITMVRKELVRAGDRRKPLYVTEVAFPASRGRVKPIGHQRQETAKGMARRLSSMYSLLARRRAKLRLERVYWFTWGSRYGKSRSNFDFAGLIKTADGITYKSTPALSAYRRTAQRWQGCAKNALGTCRQP